MPTHIVTFLQREIKWLQPTLPSCPLHMTFVCLRSSPLVLSLFSQSLRSGFYSCNTLVPSLLLFLLLFLFFRSFFIHHMLDWTPSMVPLAYVSVYFLSCLKSWNLRMRQGQHSLSLQKRLRSSKITQRLVCARHSERTLKSQLWEVLSWPLGNLQSNEAEKVSHKISPHRVNVVWYWAL